MSDFSDIKYHILDGFFIHDCCVLSDHYYVVCAEEFLPEEKFDYYISRGRTKIATFLLSNQNDDEPPSWGGINFEAHSYFNTRLINTDQNQALMRR